uniref:(California timema) hypothetical protein n=1 Tax=Timema californicum TaxID=61474 RepID=A0A7R9JC46_TIMCA|nr:unnamed protein product [Timema californicum]
MLLVLTGWVEYGQDNVTRVDRVGRIWSGQCYSCWQGGLKAVVWTDVIQTFIMFGAMLLVIIKGTLDIGGISVVWERNFMSGRIEAPKALGIFVVGVLFLIALCSYSGLLIFATFHECDPLTTKVPNTGPSVGSSTPCPLVQAQDQLLPLLVMNTLGLFPGLPGLFMAGVFSAALSSLSTGLNSMAAVVLEDLYKSYSATPLTEKRTNLLMRAVVVTLGILCVSLVFAVERLGSVLQMSMSLSGITNGASLGLFSAGLFLPWVNSMGALVGGAAGMVFMSWIVLGTQVVIASGDLSFEAKPVSVEGCGYDYVPPVDKTTGLDNKFGFLGTGEGLLQSPVIPTLPSETTHFQNIPCKSYKLESESPNVVRCCQLGLHVAILVMKDSSSPDDRSHFNLEVLVYTLSVTLAGKMYQTGTGHPSGASELDRDATVRVFTLFRMSYMWYTLLGSLVSMLVALVVSYFTRPNKISSVDRKLLSPVIRRFLPRKTDVPMDVDMTSMNGCKINVRTFY